MRNTLVRLVCASLLCACTPAESAAPSLASDALADAGDAADAGPCCAPWATPGSSACSFKRDDAGVCQSCCHGDVCGYPPDPDGTCSGPSGPPLPGKVTRVSLAPADLTTNVAAQPLAVLVQGEGGDSLPVSVSGVASAITLKTYPELADVPFDVTSTESATYGGRRLTLEVRPAAPLTGRWYVLGLASVPPDLTIVDDTVTRAIAGAGAYAARFDTAGGAVRRSVTLCTKGAVTTVAVDFSEAITLDASTPEQLKVSDSAGACDFTAFPPEIASIGGLAFACHGDAWITGHVHLETGAGLRSAASGASAGRLDPTATTEGGLVRTGPASEDFDFASVAERGSCKVIVR